MNGTASPSGSGIEASVSSRLLRTTQLGHGLFFAYLIALVVWLYDSVPPVDDVRFSHG